MLTSSEFRVVEHEVRHSDAFRGLNLSWIEEYFEVEEINHRAAAQLTICLAQICKQTGPRARRKCRWGVQQTAGENAPGRGEKNYQPYRTSTGLIKPHLII